MNIRKIIPYPWSAARLMIAFHPFSILGGTWFDFVYRRELSECARAAGSVIWWLRLGPFTLSYGRML